MPGADFCHEGAGAPRAPARSDDCPACTGCFRGLHLVQSCLLLFCISIVSFALSCQDCSPVAGFSSVLCLTPCCLLHFQSFPVRTTAPPEWLQTTAMRTLPGLRMEIRRLQSQTGASGAQYGKTTRVHFSSSHLSCAVLQWTPLPGSYNRAAPVSTRFRSVHFLSPVVLTVLRNIDIPTRSSRPVWA